MLVQSLLKVRSLAFHGLMIVSIMVVVAIPFFGELTNRLDSSKLQLTMYKSSLESDIARYKFLPFILSQNDKLHDILAGRLDREESGYFMQRTKYATNVSAIYLLDDQGNTVAASNWHRQDSYVGRNFGFRPYYRDAMAGRLGQFYGIGISSLKPGFFIAYGLREKERVVGAVAIEINLSDLESIWRSGPDEILVHDVNDMVFLSSNKLWKHSVFGRGDVSLIPDGLTDDGAANPSDVERQVQAALTRCYRVGDITFYDDSIFGCVFPGKISIEEKIIEFGWTILSLQTARLFYVSAGLVLLIGTLIYAIILFSYRSFRNKFNRSIQKLRNQLVENSKLAAMGQMATEVAHEFNQPLAAIYMLLDTTRLLLERKQFRQADDNLVLISSHIEKMTQQISQMKSFASRHRVPSGDADIVAVAGSSITLFQNMLKKQDVKLSFEASDGEIHVPCNEIGLEQIFSNLITNALDAMADQVRKQLSISISRDEGRVVVWVRDNGPGISDPSRLFESFYSTKPRGTGLGLAIVKGIIEHSSGSISARNHPDGGAEFTLTWREVMLSRVEGARQSPNGLSL